MQTGTDHTIAEKTVTEKNQEQKAAPAEAWRERLCRLSPDEQAHIAKKILRRSLPVERIGYLCLS